MNYSIIGDTQFQRSNLNKANKLFSIIEEAGLPTIFLGDMLERRGLIEAECLNTLYKYFSTSKLSHTIIVGNHCLLNMHSDETALLPLKSLPNVRIIDAPQFLSDDSRTLLMPYRRDPNRFLKEIKDAKCPFLIGHQGVREFTSGSGYTEVEAVNLEDLKGFKQVIMGHYHTPNEKGNTVFLGSPFSHSFSEANEIKHLAIFNEQDGIISYIETDFPRHMTCDINCDKIQTLIHINFDVPDHWRVTLTGSAENVTKFPKNLYPSIKFIEQPESDGFKSEINETQSHEAMFKKWLRSAAKDGILDIEEFGLNILKEVK